MAAKGIVLPSAYQRRRLVLLLAILDGLADGASARDLAVWLIFPNHRLSGTADWRGSSEKRHTQRLIGAARRMARCGYLRLLEQG